MNKLLRIRIKLVIFKVLKKFKIIYKFLNQKILFENNPQFLEKKSTKHFSIKKKNSSQHPTHHARLLPHGRAACAGQVAIGSEPSQAACRSPSEPVPRAARHRNPPGRGPLAKQSQNPSRHL